MPFNQKRMRTKAQKSDREIKKIIDAKCKKIGSLKDRDYFASMMLDLVRNNMIPVEVFESIPEPANLAKKSRFDQIYDAAMHIVTPNYRKDTLEALLGEIKEGEEDSIKIWRVVFPSKLGIPSVILRASSFQDAFALGCDYACRVALRQNRKIPIDLTVRVLFMGEKAVRRFLSLRWANRVQKRKQYQLEGREFTSKQIQGARLAALEAKGNPNRSIANYAELKDLLKLREKAGLVRISAVEHEYKISEIIDDDSTESDTE